jgi:prepilin-type N-terminal cleavage/methylation domain-containing protein
MKKIFKSKAYGMTLTELSIVLAILGILIVAGISGKFLIDVSRATTTIQQLSDRTLAFRVFFTSYDCLPGDCVDANAKIQSTLEMNGNGDGVINVYGVVVNKNEVAFVEEHLTKSKLLNKTINYTGIDYTKIALNNFLPNTKIAGGFISTISSGGNMYNIVGAFSPMNATAPDILNFSPVSATVLKIVDQKIDDSIANAGNIRCYTAPFTTTSDVVVFPIPVADYSIDCVLSALVDVK